MEEEPMTKNILLTEIKRNVMGLSMKKLLEDYFRTDEIQDALRDIGEPTSGTKDELVQRVRTNWESYNRDISELLGFIDKTSLQQICYHYNLDATPANHDILKRRIKKANLLGSGKRPTAHVSNQSSMVDDSRFYSKKPKTKKEENSQVTDVHFHFSSIPYSKWGKIGAVATIAGLVIMIIFFVMG